MKRPFCILALSDLHLSNKNRAYGEERAIILDLLRKDILRFTSASTQWTEPDYLVIAGDMIDASSSNYPLVKKTIRRFIRKDSFNIPPSHVIVTPGNHDKEFPGHIFKESDKEKSEEYWKSIFSKYDHYKKFVEDNGDYETFKKDNDPHFDKFADFYKDFTKPAKKENCTQFFTSFLTKENSSALTSCMKVFHDDKVCFLSVNTEWTDIPDSFKEDLSKDQKELLVSLPKICRPIVYDQLKEFSARYSDYTLITVMHRNPAELSWTERAAAQVDRPDILQYLFHYSDIILSGHDHIKHVLTPHLLGNRAQSFQLGSASMEDRPEDWAHRLIAGLMLVDPILHTVRFQQFIYDKENSNSHWKVRKNEDDESSHATCYPLICKHINPDLSGEFMSPDNPDTVPPDSILTLYANSLEEKNVEKAFDKQAPGLKKGGYRLSCIPIDSEGYIEDFRQKLNTALKVLSLKKKKTLFLFYCSSIFNDTFPTRSAKRFRELRDELIRSHPDAFYCGEISLCLVSVQTRFIGEYDFQE